ncbi:MAG: BTAD domain-containing putative transcriptional regulator [Candidatus Promineifilaceae bacterium]|nr:BTAD domain-containing putative transcriptional regulator [Candidatus Promineifilaceae bacterium]
MSGFRISLFGRLAIRTGASEVPLDASRAQELLAYLLLYRDQPHYREKLATLFWADSSPSRSKSYLRQTLWQLQSALGEENDLLTVDGDWIQINGDANLWLDVALFEEAVAAARGLDGSRLSASQALALEQAARLYQGDLLEPWFHDWCVFERERLHNSHLALLEKLFIYFEASGEYEQAVVYANHLLRCEPAHERTYRFLMRLHACSGNRTAALRAYRRCAAAVEEGLGVAVAQQTTDLLEQIQTDCLPDTPSRATDAASDPTAAGATLGALDRLERLEQTLLQMQRQVTQEIEALRHALLKR